MTDNGRLCVCVVMPAYNAAKTIEKTYGEIPHEEIDDILVVDDHSRDETVKIAAQLGLEVIVHPENRGYGGNQKTCYREALGRGADIIVMLHPDYQYDPSRIPALIEPIQRGVSDVVLGSRFISKGGSKAGKMPGWRYISNRFLSEVENRAFGLHLSEWHTGLRAYSRCFLERVPFERNSNDFVFDQEMLAQAVYFGFRIDEIEVPTRYFAEASSLPFLRSIRYGVMTLWLTIRYTLQTWKWREDPIFIPPSISIKT